MFAFKDLAPGETLDGLRSGKGTYSLYVFDPAEVIGKIPGSAISPILHKALGDYYYDVSLRYAGRWLETDDDIAKKTIANYDRAFAAGLSTVTMCTNYADKALQLGDYAKGIEYYSRALKEDPSLYNVHYNLAFAYLRVEQYDSALTEGEKALAVYEKEPAYLMDALMLCADAAFYGGLNTRAIAYLDRALRISAQDYRIYKKFGYMYLSSNTMDRANENLDALFALSPTNPGATQMVVSAYESYKKNEAITDFFLRNLKKYRTQSEVLGNLNFHFALKLEGSGDSKKARKAALDAQQNFTDATKYDGQIKDAVEALLARNSVE